MKKFEARAVIHYGPNPDEAFQDFAEKWASIMFDRVKDLSAADLRILDKDLREQIDILVCEKHPA